MTARIQIRRWLILSLALFFLTVYKGTGGYDDQVNYMEMAEQLWLRGSLAAPADSISAPRHPLPVPPGETTPPHHHRFPLGLALISAPFVWLGALLSALTGGWIVAREALCLSIPLYALYACRLLYDSLTDPRCGIAARPAVGVAATLLFALGTPLFNFQRLFYAEVPALMFLLLAIYAALRSAPAEALDTPSGATRRRWLALTGLALAAATACHYADLWLSVGIGLALLAGAFARRRDPQSGWGFDALALLAAPLAAGLLLLTLNTLRFGRPFDFGYSQYVETGNLNWQYFGGNLKHLLFWLLRTPWLPAALIMTAWLWVANHAPADPTRTAPPGRRYLLFGLCLAFDLQTLFWLLFQFYGMYPLRYSLPITALGAIGLVAMLTHIDRRWPRGGLLAATVIGLGWAMEFFLYGDFHFLPPVIQAGDIGLRPFSVAADGSLRFWTWYMDAVPADTLPPRWFAGTPARFLQWLILSSLLASGAAALARAAWLARRTESTVTTTA